MRDAYGFKRMYMETAFRRFFEYDRTHAEVEQEKLRKADERVAFLESLVGKVPEMEMVFENCKTMEDKLERVERMLACFKMEERNRNNEYNWRSDY